MKNFYYIMLFLICCFSQLHSIQTLIYEKISGKGTFNTTYVINKTSDSYKIVIQGKNQTTTLEASCPYALRSYIYQSQKNSDSYKFILNGSTLKASGFFKGEKMEEQYTIDRKNPWIQEFDFGLLPLLTSKKTSLNFELINPKNFKTHKMVAKKQGTETLKIHGVSYETQLVTVTLQGFKSMFWKAQIWYDLKTHDLVMYKANEGPHTPTTVVTLLSKTETLE